MGFCHPLQPVIFMTITMSILLCLPGSCFAAGGGESAGGHGEGSSQADIYLGYWIANMFLYDITRDDSTNPTTSVVQRWIERLQQHLGVVIRYTERLHKVLVRRANHLKDKSRKLKGGAPRRRFFQQNWKLQILQEEHGITGMRQEIDSLRHAQHESSQLQEDLRSQITSLSEQNDSLRLHNTSLSEQNDSLRLHNNSLSEQNDSLHQHNTSLSEQYDSLHQHNNSLSEQNDSLHQCNTSLSEQNATLLKQTQTKSMKPLSKPLSEYSNSYQRKVKRKQKDCCETSLQWLKDQGLIPTQITVRDATNGTNRTININEDLAAELFGDDYAEEDDDDFDKVNMMLMVKDTYHVSGNAYHEFARVVKEMPRHYRLKRRISELNSLWNISPTPDGSGVQQSLEDRLRDRLKHLIKSTPDDADFKRTKKIRVKLSGDGTNMGKRLHVVNFTFTILDEGKKAYSAEGNYCLAIFRQSESYDKMKEALADIRHEVETLTSITVDGVTFNITYFLGGDWKFLALVTGVDSATSEHACIWCKCPADKRYDVTKKWSLTDTNFGARTIEENLKIASEPKSKKRFNVSRSPLFPTIPLTNVVIDNLHLFLRVSDVLIRLLIDELKRQDAIAKSKKFSGSFNVTDFRHLKNFEEFVAKIGVSDYHFYVGRTSKMLKIRTLTGPEKLKLLANIQIKDLLPSLPSSTTEQIQVLWSELLELNQCLSKPENVLTASDISNFAKQAREWVEKFTAVYQTCNVTPYIHAMANHVSEFMTLHGSIISFTQQGLEKYNDCMTKQYFRASNHKGEAALRQIIEKQNRICYLGETVKRQKCFETKCSNCKQAGHKHTTCQEKCRKCSVSCYRMHLVKVDGTSIPSCNQENQY